LLINFDLEGGVLYFPASTLGIFVTLVPGVPFTARRLARLFQFCKKFYCVFFCIKWRNIWELCRFSRFYGKKRQWCRYSNYHLIMRSRMCSAVPPFPHTFLRYGVYWCKLSTNFERNAICLHLSCMPLRVYMMNYELFKLIFITLMC
jgi:hypothetical protein